MHLLVNECSQSMVIGERDKVQFGESPGCLHRADGLGVPLVPSRGIEVVILSQVVQIFNQTTTEADLNEAKHRS